MNHQPRLPDVIGIGAEKCGTTSLHYYLKAHPDVGVQRVKEMRFFIETGGTWHKGVDWYVQQFPRDAGTLMESHGGGYTAYPRHRGVPERIHSVVPDARFIYLVREPIERLISRWVHNYSNNDEHRDVDSALLDLEDVEYVPQSLYFTQLERYLSVFDASRFLIVDQGDLLRERRATLATVFSFLGVDGDYDSAEFDVIRHPSGSKRRNSGLGMLIHRVFGGRIFNRLHGPHRHWFKKILYTPVSQKIDRPQLAPETRDRLREVFAGDVRKLEEFTGRRFSGWLE